MKADSDAKYVECLKNNDFHAFDFLFKKYSESLYSFVLGITHDSFAAEEVTQIVFIKIWQKKAQINEYFSFKSFLFSITYNETISWLRKEKSEKKRISELAQKGELYSNETEQMVELKILEGIANRLIEEIPPKRREIFRLSREFGYSNKEIAEHLGISVKTVEGQITSALKFLRTKISENEILGFLGVISCFLQYFF